MQENESDVNPFDSPETLLNNHSEEHPNSIVSIMLGVWSAYLLPVICGIGLLGSLMFIGVLFCKPKQLTRQLIYMVCVFMANVATNILFAWLWIFPAKGLPYATNGSIYYFTFQTSTAMCKLHRFAYSFTSTASCNLLLLASVDRMLLIYHPVTFSSTPKRYSWYASGIVTVVSAIMMLPMLGYVTLVPIQNKMICWFPPTYQFLEAYHVLFSNSALVQPMLVGILNLTFLIRLRRYAFRRRNRRVNPKNRNHLRSSFTLFVLSAVYIVFSLPQSFAYLAAYTISNHRKTLDAHVRLAYNIADLGWNLYFLREVANIIVLFRFIPPFRHFVLSLFHCCSCCCHKHPE
ncbi:unnamed protein product [Calicophoron daubneyi]|uniref:G-protein coupled receptors family 1 profile domain-containing protein n=1 Tax=Calicophoron daubneyi TaxID=300641 RepID=A0AAV2TAA5_CALDB